MTEPRIQYTRTQDGVNLACWTMGEGPPLVLMPYIPWSHILLEWRTPEQRTLFGRLAHSRTIVRYDGRGTGLSDREVTDFTVEAHVRDLEAVVDYLGLGEFGLIGNMHSGPAAIAYAATHPDRVSRLALWCTYARGADYLRYSPRLPATRVLLESDWEMYTETMAHVTWGWSDGQQARRFASFIRESVTVETVNRVRDAIDCVDVSVHLAKVRCPTLVAHRRGFLFPSPQAAHLLASQIPNARVVLLEGASPAPFLGDADSVVDALGEFFGTEFGPAPTAEIVVRAQAPLTVLFTDLVGHAEMMSRLGDDRGREVLREHERITRDVLKQFGGTEVKTMGDGFMASFRSVTKAVEGAVALQRAFAERESGEPLHVRVGLNAGEPIEEDGDLFGATVILASRIAAKADGGEILVADTVRGLCSGKGFLFADRGEFVAKGIEEPVKVYEVNWRE